MSMTFTGDVTIKEDYPGLIYDGQESGNPWFEDREIKGVMYHAQNAMFNNTPNVLTWSLVNPAAPAYAVAQWTDGSIRHFTRSAPSQPWLTSQWVQTEPNQIFNVRDFGAIGDGNNDDTAAILSAVAAIPSSGGTLYLPAGTYKISSVITVGNYTTVAGDGYGVTTLQAAPNGGYMGSSWMIKNTDAGGSYSQPQQWDIHIRDLTVDGNANNGNMASDKGLITLDAVGLCSVDNCRVINSWANGIEISCEGDTGSMWPGPILNFSITNNRVNLNEAGGIGNSTTRGFPIRVLGASGGIISGNIIGTQVNPVAGGETNDSIAPAGCSNMVIANNNIFNGGDGINSMACYDVVISGNVILNCAGNGITTFKQPGGSNLAVSRIVINGNVVTNAGKIGINVVDGGTTGSAQDYVVSNNVVQGPGMAPQAIFISAWDGIVSGNLVDLQESNTTGITIQGHYCHCIGNEIKDGGSSSVGIDFSATASIAFCSLVDNYIHDVHTKLLLPTDITTLNSCLIRNNVNVNPPSPTSITQPTVASGLTPNPFPYDCTVYVIPDASGTHNVSEIDVNGLAVINSTLFPSGLVTPVSVRVPVNGSIKLTYTGAPKWVWIPE